jgi:hypothetical protein
MPRSCNSHCCELQFCKFSWAGSCPHSRNKGTGGGDTFVCYANECDPLWCGGAPGHAYHHCWLSHYLRKADMIAREELYELV